MSDKRPSLLGYLPALDGVRALAVVAVIVYHANKQWLGGGFLGVEVFFVISGFLITSLLIAESERDGRINLKQFWLRRARRLLPALWLLLLLVAVYCSLFERDTLGNLRGDIVAALVYGFNWFQIWVGTSYFTAFDFVPLRHLWSLAVEEQFYVLWPVLMLVMLRLGRRKLPIVGVLFIATSTAIAVFTAVTYRSGAIGAVTETPEQFMAFLGQPVSRIDFLFLGTFTRAGGLFLGAALAVFWRPWLLQTSPIGTRGQLLDGVFLLGFGGLAVCAAVFRDVVEITDVGTTGYDILFRGGFFLVGMASVAVIAAAVHPTATMTHALLGNRVMTYIGQRSYGLYLYHWPVFQMYRRFAGQGLTPYEFVLLMLLALAITESSYRFVELPVRDGRFGAWWRSRRDERSLGVLVDSATRRRRIGVFAISVMLPAFALVSVATADVKLNDISQSLAESESAVVNVLGDSAGGSTESGADSSPTTIDEGAPMIIGGGVTQTTTLDGQLIDVLAIGDSVMLGAARELTARGATVDAMKSRSVRQALEIVNYLKSVRRLGSIVVIHLGTNSTTTEEVLDQIMATLADTPLVLFLTVYVPSEPRQTINNRLINALPTKYANVKVLDWHSIAGQYPEYLYSDQTHLRPDGARFYADLIMQAVGRL
ncbi:putative peptidoglycan O-acetyltransferase YrhL [Actinomycetes bacterium]|nr:putative peptidoglycan O-acetyltransferase YrhL [Actinomycetes bacterium]